MKQKYICNPVNMAYDNRMDTTGRAPGLGFAMGRLPIPHYGAGDTTVVRFKGRYYMFGSLQGFWWTDDLVDWHHESGKDLNIMPGAAGDICQVGDWLYQCASSREPSSIYRTKDPMSRKFEYVSTPFQFWDPCMFQDDDGRVYLYWGCSNVDPIWGVEMDPETMTPLGERVVLFGENSAHHGFERNGWDNDPKVGMLRVGETDAPGLDNTAPWIEGPYMNKHDGKYYLQYAAPATELPVYADGCYVSDKPLGPFTYCDNSPFSTCRGGFYEGAGHGSSFEDEYGNWWHATTMIGAAPCSARKMGIFPLGFDADGIMYCNQNYYDYPHIMPQGKADPNSLFTGWMLLSWNKPATASSTIAEHPVENLTNESSRTYWAASRRRPGEWVMLDLGQVDDVRAVQLNFCDHDVQGLLGIPYNHFSVLPPEEQHCYHRWLLEGSADGEHWQTLCDKRRSETNMIHDLVVLEDGVQIRYLRLTSVETPFYGNFAMTGLRVFGHAPGQAPKAPANVSIARDPDDGCVARLHWDASEGADGYNVRWGIAPDKLYHSTLVYGKNELTMRYLNDSVPYFMQIDAFNGSGIGEGTVVSAQ